MIAGGRLRPVLADPAGELPIPATMPDALVVGERHAGHADQPGVGRQSFLAGRCLDALLELLRRPEVKLYGARLTPPLRGWGWGNGKFKKIKVYGMLNQDF